MISFQTGSVARKGSLLTFISALVLAAALIAPATTFAAPPPKTLHVDASSTHPHPNGSVGNPYHNIQDAINASATGDTIDVDAGTYPSFQVVGKTNLTITGSGASTIVAPSTLIDTGTGHKYTADMQVSVFVNNSSNVTIQDMTVKDNGQAPGAGGPDALVFWNASTGTLGDSTLAASYTINGDQTGQGIAVDAGSGQTTTLSISADTISGFQKNGIDIVDGNSHTSNPGTISVTVTGGSITGAGTTGTIAQNGILAWNQGGGNVSATVNGTAISNLEYLTPDDVGVYAYGTATIPTVSNVTFSNVDYYIQDAGAGAIDATSGNTFDGVTASSASGTQLATIENKMGDIMESATVDPVYLLSNTLIVTASTTINRGINAGLTAAAGGDGNTVLVTPGTYGGDVTVPASNGITLEGIGAPVLNLGTGYGINLDNNATVTNFTFEGFTVNASSGTTYAFKAYKADGLTLTNDTFDGTLGDNGTDKDGGVDVNTTNNVMFNNVTSSNFYKNGFADTSRYAAGDTAANGITFNNVTASGDGYGGISFYTANNAGTVEGSINGVSFTGTDVISNNTGPGIFIEGDTDANFGAHNTPANTVTSDGTTLDLTHVAFNGNAAYDIINYQTAPVNALGTTFEGQTGDQMTNAQHTTQDGKIFDHLDLASLGLVTYYHPQITVTIDKFLNGSMATAASANSVSFPMESSWVTANLGSGSGTYALGPTGFNSSNAYEAVTSDQASGSSYTTQEDITGSEVGASCSDGKPYALAGYTTGDSEAAAAAATPTPTVPNFSDLTSNEYVVVWNVTCPPPDTTPPTVSVTPVAGSTLSGTVTFDITVSDNEPLDPTKNKSVWVYLYNSGGSQKSQGAKVDLSSGTGTFTVDTTQLDNGDAWLDVGIVYDAAGNPSGASDNYFKDYTIDNTVAPSGPNAPEVITEPATNQTTSDATLNATNGDNDASQESFWVSTSTINTSSPNIPAGVYSTPVLPAASANATFQDQLSLVTTQGITTGGVNANMPAITPNTTYYYVAWSNVDGTWYPGQVLTVTTSAPTPSVITDAATNPTTSDATLNGTNGPVDASGSSFWVSTASFTVAAGTSPTLPSGVYSTLDQGAQTAGNDFSASLSSLTSAAYPSAMPAVTPNTTYYYAAWVNVGGTWYPGAVQSFTTSSASGPSGPNTPEVTTKVQTNVTSSDATLNAKNGNNDASDHSFWVSTTFIPHKELVDGPAPTLPSGVYSTLGLGPISANTKFNVQLSSLASAAYPSAMPAVTPSTTYYFVAWSNVDGTWYHDGEKSFTTLATDPAPTDPSVPVLETPTNSSTLNTNSFTFTWNASTGGTGPITYQYQATQDPTEVNGVLTNNLWASTTPTNSIVSQGAGDGTWYWQVQAVDSDNNVSGWSPIWSVTLDTSGNDNNDNNSDTLVAPTPETPTDGTTLTTADLTDVTWSSVTDNAGGVTYTYEVSNSSATNQNGSFVTPVFSQAGLSSPEIATPNTPDGTYYWHVMATDADNVSSPWSTTSSFTIDNSGGDNSGTQPIVLNNQSIVVNENSSVQVQLDAGVNGSATYTVTHQPEFGTLSGTGADLTYTPNANYSGPDSFNFQANNGTDSNVAVVDITVKESAPTANDQSVSVTEGGSVNFTLTGSGSDESLTFATTSSPTNGTLSGSLPDLTYTPNAGFTGPTDSFTFTAANGTSTSSPATVTITVTPVTHSQDNFVEGVGGSGGVSGVGGGGTNHHGQNSGNNGQGGQGGQGGQVLGASVYNFTANFGLGTHDEDVTQLQLILIADGYLKLASPTGYFGQMTKAAVKLYQAAHNISPVSGYVGPITRVVLNEGSVQSGG